MHRLSRACGRQRQIASGGVAIGATAGAIIRVLSFIAAAFLVLPVPCASAQDATTATISAIPDAVWAVMQGKSYNPRIKGCAQRKDLRLLTLPYRDFAGMTHKGQMIVHRRVAADVRDVFVTLFRTKSFAIDKMVPVDAYGGDDDASMADNNTSGYNCRKASGSSRLSSHARGIAIDVNPLINPYVWRKGTSPPGGHAWDEPAERAARRGQAGLILPDSALVSAFKAKGWVWGGTWTSSKDYQHFSADGR